MAPNAHHAVRAIVATRSLPIKPRAVARIRRCAEAEAAAIAGWSDVAAAGHAPWHVDAAGLPTMRDFY